MKLFNDNKEEFISYIEQPLLNKDVELELIFGSVPYKNPLTKSIFVSLIDKCNENYHLINDSTTLDIGCEYKINISKTREGIKIPSDKSLRKHL